MYKFKFDEKFLDEVGLSDLPVDDKPIMLSYIRKTFELRIGKLLARHLHPSQLAQLNSLMVAGKAEEAAVLLREKIPGYEDVIRVELIRFKIEINDHAPQILRSSGKNH